VISVNLTACAWMLAALVTIASTSESLAATILCSNDHEQDGWKVEIRLPSETRSEAVMTSYDAGGLPTSTRMQCSESRRANAVGCTGLAAATYDKDLEILTNLVLIFRDSSAEGPAIASYTGNYLGRREWDGDAPEIEVIRLDCALLQ